MNYSTDNTRIIDRRKVPAPYELVNKYPIDDEIAKLVYGTRNQVSQILHDKDDRVFVVVGPCSIHDPESAIEYANKLLNESKNFNENLLIIMRVYFEKPRTTIGWKGLINDPHLDGTYDINTGLRRARGLLRYLALNGIPSATELLDPIVPQYIADLISWTAIGARTTESQTHREMASGLSMPIGFKNGTDGSVTTAINAMQSAARSHHFLGVNSDGFASIVNTTGNPDTHIVLRGGAKGPNFDNHHITDISSNLSKNHLPQKMMIDCSHGNSNKDFRKQSDVLDNISQQLRQGEKNILGIMLESHLREGNQKLEKNAELEYGKSITDACIDIKTTHELLSKLYDSLP